MEQLQSFTGFNELLDSLDVHCSNASHDGCENDNGGCSWKGERSDLKEHLDRNCEHILCPVHDRGCKWEGKQLQVDSHVRECLFVDVECSKGCRAMVRRSQLEQHWANDCDVAKREDRRRKQEQEIQRLSDAKEADERRRREEEKTTEALAQQMLSLCDAVNPSNDELMQLQVGTHRFVATRSTLCKYPRSLLGVMFSEKARKLKRDANGVVILDCDDVIFRYVLRWLQ
jgi:hypothetical protein